MDAFKNFVTIDVETASWNGEICEIGFCFVKDGVITNTNGFKLNPECDMDPFCTRVHGLKNEDVIDSPNFKSWYKEIKHVLEGKTVIAHNMSFDKGCLTKAFNRYGLEPIQYESKCSLVLSRKVLPSLERHTLDHVIEHFGFTRNKLHRASQDAELVAKIILEMAKMPDIEEALKPKVRVRNRVYHKYTPTETTHVLSGKKICFTGTLSELTRHDASLMASQRGAVISSSVTLDLSYLVVGTQDVRQVGSDGKSTKEDKAQDYNSKGAAIEVLNEDDFFDLLNA